MPFQYHYTTTLISYILISLQCKLNIIPFNTIQSNYLHFRVACRPNLHAFGQKLEHPLGENVNSAEKYPSRPKALNLEPFCCEETKFTPLPILSSAYGIVLGMILE